MNEIIDNVIPKGRFILEQIRNGEVIRTMEFPNSITNEGKNLLLNIMFGATAKISTWYMGLIDNASFSALAPTDTASSHAGWVEFVTYSQTARPQWTAGTASSQSITNAAAVVFDITTTATVFGIFISTLTTKSGTTGTLWTAAPFASTVDVANGDQIKMTYTLSA
jgi:hypothetical protein